MLSYLPLGLSVAVIIGYKLEAYLYKIYTFLLNASCLGTFPHLTISLSLLYISPGFGVNSFATVKLKKKNIDKIIILIFLKIRCHLNSK